MKRGKGSGFTLIEPLDLARGRLPAVRKGERSAFTLIELLVVIAIIAVLASMLVPAVQSALVRGKISYCASNLRQMGIASYAYANDHKGVVPPLTRGGGYAMQLIHDTRKFIQQGAVYSQGILYQDEYAENGRMYYCPTQTEYYLSWPAYSTPIFPTGPPGNGVYSSGFIRSGYAYNPMVKLDANGRADRTNTQRIHVLAEVELPMNTILCADTFEPPDFASTHPGPAWNLGMADGHVEEVKSPGAQRYQLQDQRGFNGSNWGLYYRFLDALIQDLRN